MLHFPEQSRLKFFSLLSQVESKKTRLAILETRVKEYERSVRDLQRSNDKLKGDKDKEKRERLKTQRDKDREIAALKESVHALRGRAEKAEIDRAIAESRIGSAQVGDEAGASTSAGATAAGASAGEGFFSDVMANFKELVESNLQCSVCSELLVFASTVRCGHTFCETCIQEWLDTKGAGRADCPMCRAKIDAHHPNQALDAYIEKVRAQSFYMPQPWITHHYSPPSFRLWTTSSAAPPASPVVPSSTNARPRRSS